MMLASRVMAPLSATMVPVTLAAWAMVALARDRMLAWMWAYAPMVVELPTWEQTDGPQITEANIDDQMCCQ